MGNPFFPNGKPCSCECASESFFPQGGIAVIQRRIHEGDLLFPHRDEVVDGILSGCVIIHSHKGNVLFVIVLRTHDNGVFHADTVQGFSRRDAVAEDDALE